MPGAGGKAKRSKQDLGRFSDHGTMIIGSFPQKVNGRIANRNVESVPNFSVRLEKAMALVFSLGAVVPLIHHRQASSPSPAPHTARLDYAINGLYSDSKEIPMPAGKPARVPRRRSEPTADSQVEKVCKDLIRWVHTNHLSVGDRLPPQETLRKSLGVGNATINGAMRALTDCGALTRKRNVGTVVLDPSRWPSGVWAVGLASFVVAGQGAGSFFADLNHRLTAGLTDAGCRVRSYVQSVKQGQGPLPLSQYDQLLDDVNDGLVDAVVTSTFLHLPALEAACPAIKKLPVIHVGSQEDAPSSVIIDQRIMVHDAVLLLHQRGCRRLGVVSIASPTQQGYSRFWEGFTSGLAKAGLGPSDGRGFHFGFGLAGGQAAARALLAIAPQDRPDGLIIIDDWIAMGLANALRESGSGYLPRLVVQTNRQTPLTFALPAARFDVDADELSAHAVAMTMRRLCLRDSKGNVEWLAPKLTNKGVETQTPLLEMSATA